MTHYLQRGRLADALLVLSRESYEALRYSDLAHARMTRERSLSLARQIGDRSSEAWHIWELGEIERVAGNDTAAQQHYEQAHVLFADMSDRATSWIMAQSTIFYHRGLGDIAYTRGDPTAAERHFQASLAISQRNRITIGRRLMHWRGLPAPRSRSSGPTRRVSTSTRR